MVIRNLFISFCLLIAASAFAAPPPGADMSLAPWFHSLRMPGGETLCCDISDCRHYPVRADGTHYQVFFDEPLAHRGGCRLSEALALTADRVDLAGGLLLFESLKKRRRGIHRAVPVPPSLLDALDLVHGIRKLQSRRGKGRGVRLWPWSRMTGWRVVHRVMQDAGLAGPHASPKGLRHGFGVQAVSKGIALNMVQKWLGHAQLTTTAIYADAVGEEEQSIAARMCEGRRYAGCP